ncbi:MAG: hypothetical protein EAZ91_15375 [Cytophagales bacterium]|nr:MAG: hypothetical protein EAZ91_15375 [Cytophagales bacterium]
MRCALFVGLFLLVGGYAVRAQPTRANSRVRAFLAAFQQAVGGNGAAEATRTPVSFFEADTARVADTGIFESDYYANHPTATAKNWLASLRATFGNVLYYSIDTTKLMVLPQTAGPGSGMILLTVATKTEGLRKANQTRHQLVDEQVWQLREVPQQTDKTGLGYRIVRISSTRQTKKTPTLTLERVNKLGQAINDLLGQLAAETTSEGQRKALLDEWKQGNYPEKIQLWQGEQSQPMTLTDWATQRLKPDQRASLSVKSMNIRWVDAPFQSGQQWLRRVTIWEKISPVAPTLPPPDKQRVFYERADPVGKAHPEPNLTVLHIEVNR